MILVTRVIYTLKRRICVWSIVVWVKCVITVIVVVVVVVVEMFILLLFLLPLHVCSWYILSEWHQSITNTHSLTLRSIRRVFHVLFLRIFQRFCVSCLKFRDLGVIQRHDRLTQTFLYGKDLEHRKFHQCLWGFMVFIHVVHRTP